MAVSQTETTLLSHPLPSETTLQNHPLPSDSREQSFSISVGKDDWANQVINNVVGSNDENDNCEDDKKDHVKQLDSVQEQILEKKRLFHKTRFLELKNLPDGVTEKVRN